MKIHEAITTRRSVPLVKEDAILKEVIEQIIEAGTHAPNHFRTEPWRFFVLTGEGRSKLGEVFGEITKAEQQDPQSEEAQKKIARSQSNPLRSPVVIAVGAEPSDGNRVILQEEFAAVHAAVQNMLLTAHALGLGAIWLMRPSFEFPLVKDEDEREKDNNPCFEPFIYISSFLVLCSSKPLQPDTFIYSPWAFLRIIVQ